MAIAPERWQQVKRIFQSAIERPPAERDRFLSEACAHDPDLRSEVESLISSHDQAGDSVEALAARLLVQMADDAQPASLSGRTFGPYQILGRIGTGGMGEVYLAEDSRLGRRVALKLLPAHYTQDPERLRRFALEAKAASALNHPNILTLYEVGRADDRQYMATEYVDGVTLRQQMAGSRMSLGQVLDVAAQVAAALAAAHEAKIVHRDIKPENLMLRRDGYVKVLDFGLAKLGEQAQTTADPKATTVAGTDPGIIMGTVSYMSPEQARGLEVDARTDIWSLGVVTYEMVTAHRPFQGATVSDVLVAILEKEPLPLAHSLPEVPAELERIVRKALRKDKEERYQTIKDLLIDLRNLRKELELSAEMERSAPPTAARAITSEQSAATTTQVTEIKQHKRAAVLIGTVIIVVSAVVVYVLSRHRPPTKGASPGTVTFTQLTDQSGPEYFPSLSPDGKSFVYASYASGNWDIYLQRVGGKNAVNLTKDSPADDTLPAFSPDGERIAFRSEREGGGIFVMGATGESVKRLTDFGFNPAWSPDGKEIACADERTVTPEFVFNQGSRIWTVNVATGEKRLVTTEEGRQPNWSPRGLRIAYWSSRTPSGQRDIWTIPASGGEPVEVTNDPAVDWNPVWSPDGKYLYFASDRGGSMNLWRIPVEENSGKVLGEAEAVTTPSSYSGHLSFSHDGKRIAYVQTVARGNLQQVGFDPERETVTGQPAWITQGSRRAMSSNLSPDGEWLAFHTQGGGQQEDIFVIRRDGTSLRQLTDDIHKDRGPCWSPDGKRLAFYSDRSGKWEMWMINSDGSGLQQLTYASDVVSGPVWSPDGTRLAYRNGDSSPSIIEIGKSWREQSPEALPSRSDVGAWSPWSWSRDGRKLAVFRLGAKGILVYSLETQQYEKLTDFGSYPVWLSDSRRLLFQGGSKLYLLDSGSKKVREVLSVAPHGLGGGFAVSSDDRLIYIPLQTTEADVWLMRLE